MKNMERIAPQKPDIAGSSTLPSVITEQLIPRSQVRKHLAICLSAVGAAILLSWPFADLSYADDFAYADIALKLTQTGHLIYNGWEFAMLIAHAWWGALFIHLFGFSFQCLRFSTIPFALGAVCMCYLLVRRAGLQPSLALLAS